MRVEIRRHTEVLTDETGRPLLDPSGNPIRITGFELRVAGRRRLPLARVVASGACEIEPLALRPSIDEVIRKAIDEVSRSVMDNLEKRVGGK